jgi:hypothetical protein
MLVYDKIVLQRGDHVRRKRGALGLTWRSNKERLLLASPAIQLEGRRKRPRYGGDPGLFDPCRPRLRDLCRLRRPGLR